MPTDLTKADVLISYTGLNGGGVSNATLTAAVADRAPANAGFITRGSEAGLSNEFSLGSLASGLLKNTVSGGVGTLSTAVAGDLPAHTHPILVSLAYVIDGGGSVITTGGKGYVRAPFAGTIKSWTILGEQVNGTITIDVWKRAYANYPPTDAQSITAGNEPKIATTGNKATDSTLTGWTTSVAAGDIFGFNVDAVASMVKVVIYLDIERTTS